MCVHLYIWYTKINVDLITKLILKPDLVNAILKLLRSHKVLNVLYIIIITL